MQDEIVEPPGSHEPTGHAKTPKKAAASGWMGSALEYYDFFIYAQAAALVFPTVMYNADDPKVALILSFVTYGVGYVARPIGAFVLGHWGDTHGRKNVLVLCMLMMGGSTFAVALLPTYAAVGILAPSLLVVLRLIQGFAVGGEIAGASAMIVEHAPIAVAVRENGVDMLRVICMALMNAVPTAATVFGAAYATSDEYGLGFTATMYLWISVAGNAVAVLLIPFVGNLSDRIGRRPCVIVGALGSTLLSYAYLYAISQRATVAAFLLAMLMWGVVYQGYNAVFPSFFQELFPTKTRVTGFAVSQNIGTLITAFLPAIYAEVAPAGSNVPLIVGIITFASGIIAAIAAWTAPETYRVHLDDLGTKNAPEVPREEYERIRATV
jgi:MFS family permease